jgi:hypothetical protein
MKRIQLQIEKKSDEPNAREMVDGIFLSAAKEFNLFDNTPTSRAVGTIRSVVEAQWRGFGFGAREVEGLIVIDFFPNKQPANPLFEVVCNFIRSQLDSKFPGRAHEVPLERFIPTH